MVKEFHANYKTQMFIAVFTRAHQLRGLVNPLTTFYDKQFFTPHSKFNFDVSLHTSTHICWHAVSFVRDVWKRHETVQSRPTYHTHLYYNTNFFDAYNTSVGEQASSRCVQLTFFVKV
jgi:hypothetical protein